MWSLSGRPGDPAPSLVVYRLKRLWRRRSIRRLTLVWIPLATIGLGVWWALTQSGLQQEITERATAIRTAIVERPEFAIRRVVVTGASPAVREDVRAALALPDRASSLDLDPKDLRSRAEAIGWVASARVSVEANETLRVELVERAPAALWRRAGGLRLIDGGGVVIAEVETRNAWPDLPLVAGPGADANITEALDLIALIPDLAPRLRGLVRIGERRWDLMLSDGLRIALPSAAPAEALARVASLHRRQGLLNKDLRVVDARGGDGLILRLGALALEERRIELASQGPGEDT